MRKAILWAASGCFVWAILLVAQQPVSQGPQATSAQPWSVKLDNEVQCTNQALFNLSASGNTQIIAGVMGQVIRICHISFATTAPEDIKFTQSANCAGTTDVTGLYKSVTAIAFDFSEFSPLTFASGNAACLNQSAMQALGGIVIYAQS